MDWMSVRRPRPRPAGGPGSAGARRGASERAREQGHGSRGLDLQCQVDQTHQDEEERADRQAEDQEVALLLAPSTPPGGV